VTSPYFTYDHHQDIVPDERCAHGGSLTGIAFVPPNNAAYPAKYRNALFFGDYSRDCIWVLFPGADGLPDGAHPAVFARADDPVDLEMGPDGNLYYADLGDGQIRRVRYSLGNAAPTAVATATPRSGQLPLTVTFDGTKSSDLEGDALSYAWDLDNDGAYDDATTPTTTATFNTEGTYTVGLKVTDALGGTNTTSVTVYPGNDPPQAVIDTPGDSTTWSVGDHITFSGHATDQEQGTLPASALSWSIILHHCPSTCHLHPLQTLTGDHGELVTPDHEYPAYLEIRLTATDVGGLTSTASVMLQPQTEDVAITSSPPGLSIASGSSVQTTPFTHTVIRNGTISVSAPSPQTLGGKTYTFTSWSDGGAQTHDVVATNATTLVANYQAAPSG
jgi:PKD repeat protein